MEMARPCVDSRDRIRCPCRKCKNFMLETVRNMEDHLFINGFDATYTNWVHHGEIIFVWNIGTSGLGRETVMEDDKSEESSILK